MMTRVLELFTASTDSSSVPWNEIYCSQQCVYIDKRCDKRRKSEPDVAIGTCSLRYGVKESRDVIICPNRFLERSRIFLDCIHLLSLHEPGNELHVVSEQSIPGGSVDYFLVSARGPKVIDFVGVEIQALDTTGTVWPERQRFLESVGIKVPQDYDARKSFGMNWKMTAKTTLVQLHHKVETFEHVSKHLVLVLQDHLLDYMTSEFSFGHLNDPRQGDSMHFHAYGLNKSPKGFSLELVRRRSTDSVGIAACLGLQASPKVELAIMIDALEQAISPETLLGIHSPPSIPDQE